MIFNQPQLKQRRQEMRLNMTQPERKLWQLLRNNQMGYKFRRQHSIGNYIADFYCPELKLILEVDGESHFVDSKQSYDKIREYFMMELGVHTLRLKNDDVIKNIEGTHIYLQDQLRLRACLSSPLLRGTEGGGARTINHC